MPRKSHHTGPANITLPNQWQPMPHQVEFFNAIINGPQKRHLAVWHRRAGKDSATINAMAVASHKRVGLYYYMAPTQKHCRKIIWDNLDRRGRRVVNQAFPSEIRESTNDQEMRIILKNGSIVQLVGSDNYDSIVGTNPVGMAFSEWALAEKPQAWDYFRPILAENDGWAAFISTPRGMNHYYRMYKMAQSNPNWFCRRLTVDDTGIITPEQIQAERDAGMSEIQIQQEFYCSFLQSVEDAVFNGDVLHECVSRQAPPDDPAAPCIVGVDVARFGDDRSVIATRIGYDMKSIPLKRYGKLDNVELAEKVMQHCAGIKADAIFVDETGTGSGVADILKRQSPVPVFGINFAQKASDPQKYHNIRAEMYDRFREWTEHPDAAIHADAAEEMMMVRFDYDPGNRIKLMAKDKTKKEVGHSPDESDAMAITFAKRVPRRYVGMNVMPTSYRND